ncbi:MAG: hypothetical protein H8E41_02675 [Desulfobulbaceae bacterium]|uniref:Thioredoxin n=1 Tax=Candidatus Desulfobia pelagia TaxID=2841692 RepID=A0A8J6NCF1_9BACT|nr:hypothetical protein [Candidatus Desulfobia pelagia]
MEKQPVAEKKRSVKEKRKIRILPFVVLTVFLFVFLAGVLTGEPSRVLEQSWQICLSCIGIG